MTAKTDAQAANASTLAYIQILKDPDADLLFNDVEREVADIRGDLDDAINALRDEYGVDAATAVTDLVYAGDRLQSLAEKVAANLRQIITYQPDFETSAGLIAFELYQDITRGLEIVRLNPEEISNPNAIPQGTELQVYNR